MHFQHSAEIWQQYPQLVPGLIVAEGIDTSSDASSLLEPWFAQARERLAQSTEGQLAEVQAWRRAFSQMSLKPTQYRSAAEALLRRFKREDDLPRLHPLVDLCNAVSLAFATPIAVFDLDQVETYLEVRHAKGTETYLAFSGEEEVPPPDEVIFADAADQVHARRWTFRQSRRSVIQPETRRVLIVSEALHETGQADMARLIDSLAAQVTEVWQPPSQQTILSARQPRLEF